MALFVLLDCLGGTVYVLKYCLLQQEVTKYLQDSSECDKQWKETEWMEKVNLVSRVFLSIYLLSFKIGI